MDVVRRLFTRSKQDTSVEVVCDLDALIAKPVGFTFRNVKYVIPPISTEVFLGITENFAKLDSLREKKEITPRELAQAYADLICDLVPNMTFEIVMEMNQTQAGALLQLIIDTVTGRIHAQKKTPQESQNPEVPKSA